MVKIKVLILRAPGTNCDGETAFAFEQAGGLPEFHHVNRLIEGSVKLANFQILALSGGFSYGDDIAAGKIQANELRLKLGGDVQRFIDSGGLIIGICNGFQVLVKSGYLAELSPDGLQQVTLTNNDSGRFECRWINMVANPKSNCIFTKGIERMYLPIAHGEGKLVTSPDILPKLNVALRYCDENGNIKSEYPVNPNGSMDNIAGISDASGRIFALMPHPERHIRGTQNPHWTASGITETGDGLKIFQNAVNWVKNL
jgi:phosphoribosylformylglycinamidine synthase subunit PurQ / glutaminase